MDCLSHEVTRQLNGYQPDQQMPNPPPPDQVQQQPVMRQLRTGREDDQNNDETVNDAEPGLPLNDQHSAPHQSFCPSANKASLQLDPRDREKFVYTRRQFDAALDSGDAKTLVRMLRHGVLQQSDVWRNFDGFRIGTRLLHENKPALFAELVRESSYFADCFVLTIVDVSSVDQFAPVWDFVKAVNDHRELEKDVKDRLFSRWMRSAVTAGNVDFFKVLLSREAEFFQGTHSIDYGEHITSAATYKKNLCELLIKNLFIDEITVKSGVSLSTCRFAAGIAAAIGRSDLAMILQDKALDHEAAMRRQSAPANNESLATAMKYSSAGQIMEKLAAYARDLDPEKFDNEYQWSFMAENLYGNQSPGGMPVSRDVLAVKMCRQSLIQECLRPSLAEAMAHVAQQCYSVLLLAVPAAVSNESSGWDGESSEIDDDRVEVDQKRLVAVLASQWESLIIKTDAADELLISQTTELARIGTDFIRDLLGPVPELVDACFEFTDAELVLNSEQVRAHLVDEFSFPDSLAQFLAQSMSAAVAEQVNQPMPALPPGTLIRDVGAHLRRFVTANACREFKSNFSSLVRQRELIALFNEDAMGREEVWNAYFYAYLDALKAALPSPETVH